VSQEPVGRTERSLWAWGFEDAFPKDEERVALAARVGFGLGIDPPPLRPLPRPEAARVRPSRLGPIAGLEGATREPLERAHVTYGRSFPEIVRAFHGDFERAPDAVLRVASERDLEGAFEAATRAGAVLVPYGGGTSVVGGIHCDDARPVVVLDLRAMDRVLEVDEVSLAARAQAGVTGPALERQLAEHDVTMRFFPQSFELSTLGGWIATRAAGHWATGPTHVDDLVESVRMITPAGPFETRRLPASGAGPDPARLVLGSEGTLGVITEAWFRVVRRPRFRAAASVSFDGFERACDAVRAVVQSRLWPANCRLLDEREAMMNGVSQDGSCVLLLGFESADRALDGPMTHALALATACGGRCEKGAVYKDAGERGRDERADAWRASFLRGPYLQSALVSLGLVCDTFETACTWDRTAELVREVRGSVRAAIATAGATGDLTCRFTHAYPDGPAPYFTFVCTAGRGTIETWTAIKHAASEAVLRAGGTITHHHAVGRVHRPWWERERPALFGEALRAVKGTLDPAGILNPGVLL
jgi:alkyldihydroxyacetonephosphate synthase